MVTPDSRPRLVSGLVRANGEVFDRAMSRRIRVNEVGEFVIDGMDGDAPVSRIAAAVSQRFAIAGQTALADTIAFVESLEGCNLVNVRHPLGRYVRAVLGALLTLDRAELRECAALFSAGERVDIRGRSLAGIAAQIGLRLYLRHLPLAACSILVYGGSIFALLGDPVYSFLIPALVYAVALFGMVVHEGAHLYTLRRCSGEEWLGYLRLAPLEMGICYPYASPEVSFRVAMAGPLLPTACGAGLYVVNALHPDPLLAGAALLLVAHVLSFLPVIDSDGRHLLTYATAPNERSRSGPGPPGRAPPERPVSARGAGPADRNRPRYICNTRGERSTAVTISKIGVSLLVSTVLSTAVVMASAVGITFYAFAAGSSVELRNVFAVVVGEDGAFSVTFGAGLFLTAAVMISSLTLVIGLFQLVVARRGGR